MVTILDGFEDGDISEYSGETGFFSVTSDNPYDGTYALEPDIANEEIYRTDLSISRGETPFGAWVKPGVSSSIGGDGLWYLGPIWGVPNGENSGYTCAIDGLLGYITLDRIDQGTFTNLATIEGSDISSNEYYQVQVETWDSDGNISVTVYDSSGNSVETISATDTTYGDGGIGWHSNSSASQVGSQPYADFYTKPIPLSPPENVHFNDTQTEDELTIDWDTVSNASGYYVYRAESSGSSKSDYTQVADVSSPPYTDTGLEDGEQYFYRVSSYS